MIRVCRVFKSFNNIRVLSDISFEVKNGSILGLAGPSGCGKSTLLRCIQKLEMPDQGEIICRGQLCYMFQDFQLFPHMTVLKNLTYAPDLHNKDKNGNKSRAMDFLRDLGIESKANEKPKNLSGGQKQRVALARSLMVKPDILLCDEPTSGLDVATKDDVVFLLKSISTQFKITMIIASHDLDFLTQIADRILLLKDGVVVVDLIPQQCDDPVSVLSRYY